MRECSPIIEKPRKRSSMGIGSKNTKKIDLRSRTGTRSKEESFRRNFTEIEWLLNLTTPTQFTWRPFRIRIYIDLSCHLLIIF